MDGLFMENNKRIFYVEVEGMGGFSGENKNS